MHRLAVAFVSIFAFVSAAAQSAPPSDPYAVSFAQQSIAALTGGSYVGDAILNGNATWIAGSDQESGTLTLNVKATGESRIDLNLSGGTRTEIRNDSSGYPQGASVLNGGNQQAWPTYNCWINASWFFPALSALAEISNPSQVFLYIGQETRKGVAVQHLQTYRYTPAKRTGVTALNQTLSTMDIYLDSKSLLPLAFTFSTHSDDDAATSIGIEVDFSSYQSFGGVLVPMHVQKLIWNGLALDITITSAAFNTGVPDTLFAITASQ